MQDKVADSPHNVQQNTILFVDDERDITEIAVRALRKQGFSVIGFTDPILALREFQHNRDKYAVVISDIRMPGMDGIELLMNVKRLNKKTKVLLLSAFEIIESEHKGIKVEVDEFIAKPVSIERLGEIVQKHLM